jgi:hypothetical protein
MDQNDLPPSSFTIPLNKEGHPDFLWLAFQHYLSNSPDVWDGDTIYSHIEKPEFNMISSRQVAIWEPLVGFPKDEFLNSVLALEEIYGEVWLAGFEHKTDQIRKNLKNINGKQS